MSAKDYGWPLMGKEQDDLFHSLSAKQKNAIKYARYGRHGWMIEQCVFSLRNLEIIRRTSRTITPRGMQMRTRILKEPAQ